MKTPFDKIFCISSQHTEKKKRGPHILRVRQLFNAHPRTFSFSSLKNLVHFFRPIIYSYAVFSSFFFLFLIILANNTLVCFFSCFSKRCIIKIYPTFKYSKNISQYCKSPFLLYIYIYIHMYGSSVYNRNVPHLRARYLSTRYIVNIYINTYSSASRWTV